MTRKEKTQQIEVLTGQLVEAGNFYLADASTLTADKTSALRRLCFNSGVNLQVVKNSLLEKALLKIQEDGKEFGGLLDLLAGPTALMTAEAGNAPAKVIKEFRRGADRPILKGAFIEEEVYIGDELLDALAALKSKDELVGDIIALLQSPAKNVISSLNSGKTILAGLVKTLSERVE